MKKNVFKKRCICFILTVYSLIVIYFIIGHYGEYIKKKANIKKINSHLKSINSYIDDCKKGILTNGILTPYSKPKITALITVYNTEKYIATAIRSVQNQNFNDIEILVIDDCSSDHSVNTIKNLQKFDKRIKLISNKVNKGILYSKSLGILKAKGKFIMFLDSDDLFVNQNIFLTCFQQSINNDIDVVEFSGFESDFNTFEINDTIPKIPLYLRFKKNNETIRQPELSQYLYKKLEDNRFKLIDGFLWGKSIKAKALKDSLKIIGPQLYTIRLNYGDDRLINFALFRVAKSFRFIKEFGYIYNQNNLSITHLNVSNSNCRDELTNIFFIYNLTKNTYETEIAAFEILHRWNKIINPGLSNEANRKYFLNLIELMLRDKYISESSKTRLLNLTDLMNH